METLKTCLVWKWSHWKTLYLLCQKHQFVSVLVKLQPQCIISQWWTEMNLFESFWFLFLKDKLWLLCPHLLAHFLRGLCGFVDFVGFTSWMFLPHSWIKACWEKRAEVFVWSGFAGFFALSSIVAKTQTLVDGRKQFTTDAKTFSSLTAGTSSWTWSKADSFLSCLVFKRVKVARHFGMSLLAAPKLNVCYVKEPFASHFRVMEKI